MSDNNSVDTIVLKIAVSKSEFKTFTKCCEIMLYKEES